MDNLFLKTLNHTLQFEGGYVHDPLDRGGETFRGISRVSNPDWPGWKLIDQAKAQGARTAKLINAAFARDWEMEQAVAVLYYRRYWRPFEGLGASDRVMAKLFDTAVNVGVAGAVKTLQRAVNELDPAPELAADGIIGPKTRAGLGSLIAVPGGEDRFLTAFCRMQETYYRDIVRRNPSQAKYLGGWLRRAAWTPE